MEERGIEDLDPFPHWGKAGSSSFRKWCLQLPPFRATRTALPPPSTGLKVKNRLFPLPSPRREVVEAADPLFPQRIRTFPPFLLPQAKPLAGPLAQKIGPLPPPPSQSPTRENTLPLFPFSPKFDGPSCRQTPKPDPLSSRHPRKEACSPSSPPLPSFLPPSRSPTVTPRPFFPPRQDIAARETRVAPTLLFSKHAPHGNRAHPLFFPFFPPPSQ